MNRSWILVAIILTLASCAGAPAESRLSPAASGRTPVCEALLDRFIGLPSGLERGEAEGAASAGRWWIRRCHSEPQGSDLAVEIEGPGWFWVDRLEGDFQVRQHVHFRARASLVGRFDPDIGWSRGVVSLWFRPREANVDFEPLSEVSPRPQSALWAVLQRLAMPLPRFNVNDVAKRRLAEQATLEFERALARGYTLLYDIERQQHDFAVDLLPEGVLPEHPFDDGQSWLANERVVLAPGGAHVLGPFEPAERVALDARVTAGQRLAYRAVCATDLRRAFESAERGQTAQIAARDVVDTGQLAGGELATSLLGAPDCSFYLVLSPLGDRVGAADVRVRAT